MAKGKRLKENTISLTSTLQSPCVFFLLSSTVTITTTALQSLRPYVAIVYIFYLHVQSSSHLFTYDQVIRRKSSTASHLDTPLINNFFSISILFASYFFEYYHRLECWSDFRTCPDEPYGENGDFAQIHKSQGFGLKLTGWHHLEHILDKNVTHGQSSE